MGPGLEVLARAFLSRHSGVAFKRAWPPFFVVDCSARRAGNRASGAASVDSEGFTQCGVLVSFSQFKLLSRTVAGYDLMVTCECA